MYVAISDKSEWLSDARLDILLQKSTFEGLNECEINIMVKGMISHDFKLCSVPHTLLLHCRLQKTLNIPHKLNELLLLYFYGVFVIFKAAAWTKAPCVWHRKQKIKNK